MIDALTKKYLVLALDPIHIGTHRDPTTAVGHSPNFGSTIARDIDRFPLIPASSLKGCTRALCSVNFGVESCDGKGWNCPQPHRCFSCSVFGFSNYHHGGSSSSLVRFSSASVLAIPVRVSATVFWLTSWFRLSRSGLLSEQPIDKREWGIADALTDAEASSLIQMLRRGTAVAYAAVRRVQTRSWPGPPEVREAFSHLAVVDEYTLTSFVEHSTDYATSVSIDPKSGRAKPGALFDIEHINRWCLLSFEVTYVSPVLRGIREFLNTKNSAMPVIQATLGDVTKVVEGALERIRFFGIGGKRSRGYGRALVWPLSPDDHMRPLESHPRPNDGRSIRVMISYSHVDKNLARRLAADLQEERLDVWLDEREVLVGDSIHTKVEEGLSGCDYLVALLSPASLESPWVRDEIDAARTREKGSRRIVLLPAVLDGVDEHRLPALLQGRRFAVLAPYDSGLQELVKAVKVHEERRRRSGS